MIYLDYNATTPCDVQVFEAMKPFFSERFGNPASQSHSVGWDAERVVEKSRTQVSELLKCRPQEIIFTSGATESNNWALRGVIESYLLNNPQQPIHIISTQIEHASVKKTLCALQKIYGLQVDFLPVNDQGVLQIETLKSALKPETKLVSVMAANNEVGSIQPLKAIGEFCRSQQIYFHTDATQLFGKAILNVDELGIDLLSLSAHKMYGPKGVGALYVRRRQPKVSLQPLFLGGGQEFDMRSGTLNVPGIVGLGKACELCKDQMNQWERVATFRNRLEEFFKLNFGSDVIVNGEKSERIPNTLNISFKTKSVAPLLRTLSEVIAVSQSSACSSGEMEKSHSSTLVALGRSDFEIKNTLRMSLGMPTTLKEIEEVEKIFLKALT